MNRAIPSLSGIRKIKCPLAICVIVSFATVFGCDLLCALGVVSFSSSIPAAVSTASHSHSHEGDHDHHGKATAASQDQNSHGHRSDKHNHDNEAENCCDNITQQFYSSLVTNSRGSLGSLIHAEAYRLIYTLTLLEVSKVESSKGLQVASSFDHYSNGPPGRKAGQHICILLSTFQI